jgi:hypothetical protein
MSLDPVETNPDHYKVVFENDRVFVELEQCVAGAPDAGHLDPG